MKLAAHYNKASIIASVSVLMALGIINYLIINHVATHQLDNDLTEEAEEVIDYVNINHTLPKPHEFDEDQTSYAKTSLKNFTTIFFDAPYSDPKENETEEGRGVSALVKTSGQDYIVTIVESREDIDDLVQIISIITVLLTAVLLIILIVTNRYMLNGLWKPFYHILSQVKKFNLADTGKPELVESNVDEFTELSDAVTKMSARVSTDYQGLKTFTENASHEMMTPLAVITSKLDILIQDEKLSSDQFSQITDIYSAANKLARLNQSLLLLVKIDNNLLPDTELLNLETIIFEKAQQFQELIQNKKIVLNIELEPLEINSGRYLIDVLINNLFSNAIRHNKTNGAITIRIAGGKLIFQNTSEQTELNPDAVFERFYKGKSSEGTGLGLAIMKNICSQYNFDLQYRYTDQLHTFEIDFKRNY
jgi:signal transduction histidine kinase